MEIVNQRIWHFIDLDVYILRKCTCIYNNILFSFTFHFIFTFFIFSMEKSVDKAA